MMRRGGVKRTSGIMYEEVRGALKMYLEGVMQDAVEFTSHRYGYVPFRS